MVAPRVVASLPLVIVVAGVATAVVLLPVGIALVVLGVAWFVGNIVLGSPRRIVARLGAAGTRATETLESVIEGLCVAHGFRLPDILVIDDRAPNAAILGWSGASATLIVTSGLLETMSRVELEGVVAHELAHLRRGDVRNAAFATVASGALSVFGRTGVHVAAWLLDPAREPLADIGAAAMTRYPPGVRAALVRVAGVSAPAAVPAAAPALSAPLWFARHGPEVGSRAGELELTERIDLLAEL